jgi:hypothetical protein
MEGLLIDPIKAFDFMMAGNSTVTFKAVKSRKHFTYKVKRAKDRNIRFVSVLFGDNTSEYMYIGMLTEQGNFIHTRGSKCHPDAASFKVFGWTWAHIRALNIPDSVEVWHEGRCGKCGRKLTDPESIEQGLGPICRKGE